MYCRKCYTNLAYATDTGRCSKCNHPFDPAKPRSYLRRPFPSTRKIIVHLLITTAIGFLAAFVVASFQMAAASGH